LIASCEAIGPIGSVWVGVSAGSVTTAPLSSLSGWPSATVLRDLVLRHVDSRHVLVGVEVLDRPLADQEHSNHQRDRQQHVKRDPGQIAPGVADGLRRMAGEAADQRDHDDDAGGGGKEVLHRQAEHLGQVAHGRLAGIALPVRIGGETDRSVERRIRADVGHRLGIQRQPELQALKRIHRQRAEDVEQQDRQDVVQPAHFLILAHATQTVEQGFEAAAEARSQRRPAFHHGGDVVAERPGRQEQQNQVEPEQ
jgi:hypothetical protein